MLRSRFGGGSLGREGQARQALVDRTPRCGRPGPALAQRPWCTDTEQAGTTANQQLDIAARQGAGDGGRDPTGALSTSILRITSGSQHFPAFCRPFSATQLHIVHIARHKAFVRCHSTAIQETRPFAICGRPPCVLGRASSARPRLAVRCCPLPAVGQFRSDVSISGLLDGPVPLRERGVLHDAHVFPLATGPEGWKREPTVRVMSSRD